MTLPSASDIGFGYLGLLAGALLFMPALILVSPTLSLLGKIEEKPARPDKFWTKVGLATLALSLICAAVIAVTAVWFGTAWVASQWGFAHVKSTRIGSAIGVCFPMYLTWVTMGAGFVDSRCRMDKRTSKEVQKRPRGPEAAAAPNDAKPQQPTGSD